MNEPAQAPCATPRCDNPTHDQRVVCTSCVANLRGDLRELPDLLADLEVTLTRQDATGAEHIPDPVEAPRAGDGPGCAATALAFRPMASDVGRYLHATLEHWTRHLLDALGLDEADAIGARPQHLTGAPSWWTLELAAWLDRHPTSLATDPEAGALVENIRFAVEDVRRVVFPRLLAYVGPCTDECGAHLYAPHGAEHVRCRVCRRRWVIADRVAELRERADGVMLPAEQMARLLPRIAADIPIDPLTADQIRGFGRRGRLEKFPPYKAPRYKLGEVTGLMQTLLEEKLARQERLNRRHAATTHDRVLQAHQRLRDALRTA